MEPVKLDQKEIVFKIARGFEIVGRLCQTPEKGGVS
jgi:hypothetical protein